MAFQGRPIWCEGLSGCEALDWEVSQGALKGAAGQLESALCGKLLPRFLRDHVWPWLRSRHVLGPGSGRQEESRQPLKCRCFFFSRSFNLS